MEKVHEASDEFSEIREIILRYDTLTTTHKVFNLFVYISITFDQSL